MSNTGTRKSIITNLMPMAMLLLTVVLLIGAVWNWSKVGWPELIWLAAFIAMSLIRFPHGRKNSKNTIVSDENNAVEILLLGAMFMTMSVLPLLHLATGGGVFAFTAYALPSWAAIIGALLMGPFLWLFWRSHADLGRNWSPGLEMHAEHTLVTSGVYKRIRHPMYAAIWLAALAQPLLIQNWIAGFLVVPAFLAMHIIRIPREEAMMRKKFGTAYEAYMKRTGRIWPGSS